jgi:dCMP deaminase
MDNDELMKMCDEAAAAIPGTEWARAFNSAVAESTARQTKWNKYFIQIMDAVAMGSKDPSTKVACVIAGPDHEIRATGYNGLPRGCVESEARNERPEKYYWYEHAERNAIYNACRHGAALHGCTAYVSGISCCDCARALIQVGIARIYVRVIEGEHGVRWAEHYSRSVQMLKEAGIPIYKLNEDGTLADE